MSKAICVFCSSSSAVDGIYNEAAAELGAGLAARRWKLVYGGTDIGLMGVVARAVHAGGGQVIGVIPEVLRDRGIGYMTADEHIVTRDMRERKAVMGDRSDAFLTMPGGFGTLEELAEVITLKQLQYHSKPIVLLNTGGFYDPLISLFEHFYTHKFAKPGNRALYHVAADVDAALSYIEAYQPADIEPKWF